MDVKLVEDQQSNLYVAGMFTDSLQLDSQTIVDSIGSFQLFLAKYSPERELLDYIIYYTDYEFRRPLVKQLEVNQQGDLFLAGNFYLGIFDDRGDTLLYTLSSLDEFIVKFDNNLNRQWIHRIGGSNNTDVINKIRAGAQGDLVIGGAMSRQFDYDLSDSIKAINGHNSGSPFIVKYNAMLDLEWVNVLQNSERDVVLDLVMADDGSTYSVTSVTDTISIQTQTDTLEVISKGASDLMMNKWSTTGNLIWTQLIQGSGMETLYNIEIDATGNIYLLMQTNSPEFLIDSVEFTQKNGYDVLVMKFSPEGSLDWMNQIGGTGLDPTRKMFISTDKFLLKGFYSLDLGLNTRDEGISIPVVPGQDFIASYNFDGDLLSASTLTGWTLRTKSDYRITQSAEILVASGITAEETLNPLPSGRISPSSDNTFVLAKYCLPNSVGLQVDSTCLDGQLLLLADPAATSTNFYLVESKQSILEVDSLFLDPGINSVIITHRDENQCPVYEELDLTDNLCTITNSFDWTENADFQIFPSPMQDHLEMTLNPSLNIESISIFDQLGHRIMEQLLENEQRETMNLQVSHLVPGVYYIFFNSKSNTYARKLIKA